MQPYVIVCPFFTVFDTISQNEFFSLWTSGKPVLGKSSALMMTQETLEALQPSLGMANNGSIQVEPVEGIQLNLSQKNSASCAIVPAVELQPDWKRIAIAGQPAPWEKGYDPTTDVLAAAATNQELNFERDKVTTLLLTGTTALARTTAYKMAVKGVLYPAQDILPIFQESDLRHISNESSFWSLCPEPVLAGQPMQFCTPAAFLELFQHLGVNVVELTGNHLRDYDWPPLLETFQLLEENKIAYYGAGRTIAESGEPLFLEHHGNRFVFIGCNIAGPEHVFVSDRLPGVNRCDIDAMVSLVKTLSQEGNLVVVTLQYYETYSRVPTEMQERDFERLSKAGAVIVSGSQAHFPQIMRPAADRFIHYGLGNLFFDQMDRPVKGTRQEFLDRYIFYEGRLLQVELITALLEDYARPRLMDVGERQEFLEEIFSYVK